MAYSLWSQCWVKLFWLKPCLCKQIVILHVLSHPLFYIDSVMSPVAHITWRGLYTIVHWHVPLLFAGILFQFKGFSSFDISVVSYLAINSLWQFISGCCVPPSHSISLKLQAPSLHPGPAVQVLYFICGIENTKNIGNIRQMDRKTWESQYGIKFQNRRGSTVDNRPSAY